MLSALMKSGVLSTIGPSRPLKVTCLASFCTPARSSTAFSEAPRQRALPMAPLASWPPATRARRSRGCSRTLVDRDDFNRGQALDVGERQFQRLFDLALDLDGEGVG